MYLIGHKVVTLDAQGRITLPADMRNEFLEDDPKGKVCLIRIGKTLWGFSPEGHKTWVKSFFPNGFNPRNADDQNLNRELNSGTVKVEIDKAGHVSLSKLDKEDFDYLGYDEKGKELVVVGVDNHFELWDSKKWASHKAKKHKASSMLGVDDDDED